VNFLRRLALQGKKKKLDDSSRLGVVETARVRDMLPSLIHDEAFPGRTTDTRKPQIARVTSTINFFHSKAVSKITTSKHQIRGRIKN